MSLLLDPFSFAFFGRALLAGLLVGIVNGALGPFVMVRRMAYIGHGLSQSVMGGVGVALVVGLGLYPGAIGATAIATLAIYLARRRGILVDTAIGVVASAMFALGVVAISINRDRRLNVSNLLFGNILGVSKADLIVVGVVTALCTVTFLLFYKQLLATTHNPKVAAAHGVSVPRTEAIFSLLLALAVVSALQVLGVLLVAATLLIPAATASLAFRSFGKLVVCSICLNLVATVSGLYLSYYHDIASGPAIVLAGTVLLIAVAVFAPNRHRHSGTPT